MVQSVRDLMICKVTRQWYDVVKGEYFSSGTDATNFWTVNHGSLEPKLQNFEPGNLVLYVLDYDGHLYIVGGGFFMSWVFLKAAQLWDILGVGNGVGSFEEFVTAIQSLGGDLNSTLTSGLLTGTFIFTAKDSLMIPDEFASEFMDQSSHFVMSSKEPIGKYLERIVNARREPMLDHYGMHWPGIYYVASHRNLRTHIAGFFARVMTAYKFQCAVSGTKALPVLEVANIQPFYDNSLKLAQNGIVLRCDINKMFSRGYITLECKKEGRILVRVSDKIKSVWADDYSIYDGKALNLPDDPKLWPKKEYIKWHNQNCFEHWLKRGGSGV